MAQLRILGVYEHRGNVQKDLGKIDFLEHFLICFETAKFLNCPL